MATRIFDRETLLDLVVNAVPLFIMAFFVVAFAVLAPFGFDPLASLIQFALMVVPFVALLVLTYFSAKAISGAETSGPVFIPGQTTPPETAPIEGEADETGGDHAESAATPEAGEPPGRPEGDTGVEEDTTEGIETGETGDGTDETTADDDADESDDETASA